MFKSLKVKNTAKDYRNYRWFYTKEGKLVVGGKSEDQNELVLRNFLKPNYVVMHTSKPGSGFMIIQSDNPSKEDLNETAIFCGAFSKQWKLGKKQIDVDIFKGNQVFKTKLMKTGTFGVRGRKQKVKVKLELVLVIQKGKLRSVPKVDRDEEILANIKPGNLSKEKAAEKIAEKIKSKPNISVSKEEIMQVIPSSEMSVR